MEDNKTKVYNFIKSNLMNFIVVLTSVAYTLYGMVKIEPTGLTVWEVITKAGISVVIGLMIKQGIGENGFSKGYSSIVWSENFTKYNNCCNTATPHIEKVDNFYIYEEIENKKSYRRQVLSNYRIKYSWFFTEDGEYIENKEQYDKLDKKQKKALHKCINVKIHNLNLFSEYDTEIVANTKKEITDKDQRFKMFGKNGVAQVLTALAGAYFIPLWEGWNWGSFITSTIQVCIWVFCGVIQLYANYNYIVIEKVNKLKRKMELIIKFVKGCEKGLYSTNPYETKGVVINENE